MDKLSYALGVSLGNSLKNSGFDSLNYSKFSAAIQDSIEGKQLEMSVQESQELINQYFIK